MLKFFRKYNKLILAVGGSILMVAFLIEPATRMFYGTPGDRPLGHIDGEPIRVTDQQTAANEMDLLGRMHPIAGHMAREIVQGEPLLWTLMVRDAYRLGISTSQMEVHEMLSVLGFEDAELTRLATETGASPEFLRQAVRHWLMLDQYRGLMTGRTYMPPVQRLAQTANGLAMIQQAEMMGDELLFQQAQLSLLEVQGAQRLSEPVIRHFMYSQQSHAGGRLVHVPSERYLDAVDAPSDSELAEHFERYRDVRRGESEPYGFGYMLPQRVRIEYLEVPIDAAMQRVRDENRVEEVDVLAYYNDHPEVFRDPETEEVADFEQVREQIREGLMHREARDVAQQAIRTAQSLLVRDGRGLAEHGGYRVLPEDFEPADLDTVAEAVEQRTGIRPRVHRHVDEWVALAEAQELPGLGAARLEERQDLPITAYVGSVRELEPGLDNPLIVRRLQAGLASAPLVGPQGSRYLFRVRDAEPEREPASLEEVRDEVERDVRLLAAYRKLQGERSDWLERARRQGLAALAEAEELQVLDVPMTARRVMGRDGRLSPPHVPGLGRSEAFAAALFDLATELAAEGELDLAQRDEAERTGAVALDRIERQGLALFRVDAFEPLTRQQYVWGLGQPVMPATVDRMLVLDQAVRDGVDPSMTIDAVSRRLGFERAEDALDDELELDPAPRQPRPGQIPG